MKKIKIESHQMTDEQMDAARKGAKPPCNNPYDAIIIQCPNNTVAECSGCNRSEYVENGNRGVICDGVRYPCPTSSTNKPVSGWDCTGFIDTLPPSEKVCCNKFPGDYCEYHTRGTTSGVCDFKDGRKGMYCKEGIYEG